MSSVKNKLRYFLDPPKVPLENIQKWMLDMIISPNQSIPNHLLSEDLSQISLDDIIKPSKRLSSREILAIYQRSYSARLRNCMANQFGALEYALGKELFQLFADQYLQTYPSKSYNLIDLGKDFRDFLEETRPDKNYKEKESWPDFLIELANFEFNITTIFDVTANEEYTLAEHDTSDIDLGLIPVFYLFKHNYPISTYYKAYVNDHQPDLPFPEDSYCVVIRNNYKIGLFEVLEEQFYFLSILKEAKSITEAKDIFIQKHNFLPAKFNQVWTQWKKRWIDSGFFMIKK